MAPRTKFVSLFKFGRCLNILKELDATEVMFVGSPFASLRPTFDNMTVFYLAKRKSFWVPHAFFYALQDMLKDHDIVLRSPLDFFPKLKVEPGFSAGRCDGYDPNVDILAAREAVKKQSWKATRQAFIFDQGRRIFSESQTMNGTNGLIKKFGSSRKREETEFPVLCKIAVPPFERIDVPTIGIETVRLCAKNGIRAVVVDGDNTILMQRDEVIAFAMEGSICVYAL
jgi:DUF1009 family protein